MSRLLFEKTGDAVWISHLDLMRLFQRAFQRAGLALTHTHGFNPRPSVSIALPLSVGVASRCELLDFSLDGEAVPEGEILTRLNEKLIPGVKVLDVYSAGRKTREIAYLDCVVTLEYDGGIPDNAADEIMALFSRENLLVEKKSKTGSKPQDLIPLIRKISFRMPDENTLQLLARIRCQEPALNPMQLCTAIERYLPDLTPDFASCAREEIMDENEIIFR